VVRKLTIYYFKLPFNCQLKTVLTKNVKGSGLPREIAYTNSP